MNYLLEKERLRLRALTWDDAAFIVALVNTPGWLTYIGDRNIHTIEQARDYLTNGPLKSYSENGFGLWLVELKKGALPIGMCGLLRRDYLEHPDIGFAFLPDYQGKGYAYEAAEATISLAKEKLNLSTICAITLPDNKLSISLLKRIGMTLQGTIQPPGSPEELSLYSN